MVLIRKFAEFAAGLSALPSSVEHKTRQAVQDAVASAVSGIGAPAASAAMRAAPVSWGKGDAGVWFSSKSLTAPGAAFVNSTLISVMDLDDGHRAAAGHPGAAIIPAVLATLAGHDVDPNRILPAIALGYEVAVRIAASRDYAKLTTMVSGPWVGQGVAAAAAYLRQLTIEQTEQAITLAAASAPNLQAVGYSKVMGNHLKEGIPWAAATGLTAVELAANGYTGPTDALDNEELFKSSILLEGLGESWALSQVYFKPYSCCRWAHAAMDAALELQRENKIDPQTIATIKVETFGWALRLNNERAPETLESAQYSVPFCLGLVLTEGPDAFLPMQQSDLSNPRALNLAQKVALETVPDFDKMFPAAVPARVLITLTDGTTHQREILAPRGEPTNPLSMQELDAKLEIVCSHILHKDDADRVKNAVKLMWQGDFKGLSWLLSQPLTLSGTAGQGTQKPAQSA